MGEHTQDFIDAFLLAHGENPDLWFRPPANPRDLLIEKEEGEPLSDEIIEAQVKVVRRFFEMIFTNGAHPSRVVKNLYAMAYVFFPEILPDLKSWGIAKALVGESRSEFHKRTQLYAKRYKRRRGHRKMVLTGRTKQEEAEYERTVRGMTSDRIAGTNATVPF